MKYMLLIYDDEQARRRLTEVERQQIMAEYGQFTQQIKSTGHYGAGAQLHPAASATSVKWTICTPALTSLLQHPAVFSITSLPLGAACLYSPSRSSTRLAYVFR